MNKLKLLKIAENQDVESFEEDDLKENKKSFKNEYEDFYNDIKQPHKFVKEDW